MLIEEVRRRAPGRAYDGMSTLESDELDAESEKTAAEALDVELEIDNAYPSKSVRSPAGVGAALAGTTPLPSPKSVHLRAVYGKDESVTDQF